ncbi:hypothetical protein APT65_00116 [Trabzonvirus APT65]|uniref:Uncharacterized protein n=1 Tax=Aeromonas phage APT65 TaxID=2982914 RepID=A0A9E8GCW0_9CAUD|nr:hypothetical protein APT65_00116 [Aeromonas phage APT65]
MLYSMFFLMVIFIAFYGLSTLGTMPKGRRVVVVILSSVIFSLVLSSVPNTAGLVESGQAWVEGIKNGWLGLISFVASLFSAS